MRQVQQYNIRRNVTIGFASSIQQTAIVTCIVTVVSSQGTCQENNRPLNDQRSGEGSCFSPNLQRHPNRDDLHVSIPTPSSYRSPTFYTDLQIQSPALFVSCMETRSSTRWESS
ncbi:hypothetical protein QCA50_007421 [Cerrena zonata]|uniref:Uncharacterized protein n=1 Tax=Cerrena zonata TaxID=2478898 RepID=A0AAW0GHE5_9APHY